jgi:hydrogenase nickel incorporation protein HypA/HybF
MHELAIAKELSGIVYEVAGRENLEKVTKIDVCFGQMIQVVPEIFTFALEETIRDTVADGAEIAIEVLPAILLCRSCGREFKLENNTFVCPGCGSSEIEMKQGREIYVKSIEGE